MNHLMAEYLVKTLSEEFDQPARRKNRLMAQELRTSRREMRRRRKSR
jgi:hypothetical protein